MYKGFAQLPHLQMGIYMSPRYGHWMSEIDGVLLNWLKDPIIFLYFGVAIKIYGK